MIIGIDGGGTNTKFLLTSKTGHIQAKYEAGPAHHFQIGFNGFAALIHDGVAHLLSSGKTSMREIEHITIGIPGFGESRKDTKTLLEILRDMLPHPFEAVNDVKLAWAGACACAPGICILSGTGSMAYAVDEENTDIRNGGWGHFFGDEGSAFWLGQRTCQLFSKMSDGRCEKGPLYYIMKEALKLEYDFALINYIGRDNKNYRSNLASTAKFLSQAALKGDVLASQCFHAAAKELSLMIHAICKQASFTNKIPLSYLGGVFSGAAFIIKSLERELHDLPIVLQKPILNATKGACLYSALALNLDKTQFLTGLLNE